MPERSCDGCRKQEEWGCYARSYIDPETGDTHWVKPAKLPVTLLGEESFACPRQPLRENPRYWQRTLFLYGLYKKGHLPNAGAVVDQSNRALETFQVLDDVNAQIDQIEAERRARQNNSRGRGSRRR